MTAEGGGGWLGFGFLNTAWNLTSVKHNAAYLFTPKADTSTAQKTTFFFLKSFLLQCERNASQLFLIEG